MNLRCMLLAAVSFALAGAAYAHDCSGGTDGGMDATGNECNVAAAIVSPSAAGNGVKTAAAPRIEADAARAVAAGKRLSPRHAARTARTSGLEPVVAERKDR